MKHHEYHEQTKLGRERRLHGLTLCDVSACVGIDIATLSRAERGMYDDQGITLRTALRLAKFYKGTVEQLFPEEIEKAEIILDVDQECSTHTANRA